MTEFTPPLLLVQQWVRASPLLHSDTSWAYELFITQQAARWGADQELEACVSYVDNMISGNKARALRATRRPKPPSLKEQALELTKPAGTKGAYVTFGPEELELISRALEQLDD